MKKKYKVRIRRKLAPVKPDANKIDGKTFLFTKGWDIEDDHPLYAGEMAMITADDSYPIDAPGWIASGDLEEVGKVDVKIRNSIYAFLFSTTLFMTLYGIGCAIFYESIAWTISSLVLAGLSVFFMEQFDKGVKEFVENIFNDSWR